MRLHTPENSNVAKSVSGRLFINFYRLFELHCIFPRDVKSLLFSFLHMHLIHKLSVKSISRVRVERGTNAQIFSISLYREKNVKKSFEDIAEHLFNHCKSKFLAEVNLSSRFLVFI